MVDNNILNKSVREKVLWGIVILFWFVAIYLLNRYTYFTSDDFRYHFIYESGFPLEENTRITNVFQIIPSMINHYNLWGGRIPAHTLVQLFLMLGKSTFNIINTCGYIFLAFLIYWHSNFKKSKSLILFNLILLMMWFFIPQFGLSVLWVSGSGNYLWNMILILLFLLPYRICTTHRVKKQNVILSLIMIILGICAGWTNENTAGAMVCLAMFFTARYYIKNKTIAYWTLIGIISSIIGFILLVIAPGNFLRSTSDVETINAFIQTCSNILLPLIVIYLIVYFINYILKNSQKFINDLSIYYLLAAILATGAMILSPIRPERTLFGSVVFLIIAVSILYRRIELGRSRSFKILGFLITLAVIPFFMKSYSVAYSSIKSTYDFVMTEHVYEIEKEKELGNLDIVLKKIPECKNSYNAFNGSANLQDNSSAWFNRWMAEYFEVNSISGK